jgi:predicted DNA-binding ribbon-helix-helix protein
MIKKRSVTIGRHATSVTLEDAFWDALKDIAQDRNMPLRSLIAEIDSARGAAVADDGGLSSALRLYALAYYRQKCAHASLGTSAHIPNNPPQ